MRRPDSQALDRIDQTVGALRETEARLAALRAQLAADARSIAEIPDRQQRIDAALYAYWYAPDVHVGDLGWAVTGEASAGRFLRLVPPVSAGLTCDRCNRPLAVTSRTQMKAVLDAQNADGSAGSGRPYRALCERCREEFTELNRRAFDAARVEREAQLAQLRAMPLEQYLRSDAWPIARARFLEGQDAIHRQGYLQCEICSGRWRLSVRHKAPVRIAEYDALLLLCEECAQVLEANGRVEALSAEERLEEILFMASWRPESLAWAAEHA